MFNGPRYTEAEMMARLKFTVGLSLAFTLIGIVFVVLYSLIFVTQPMTQSPNDAKFFELITPIATFLTGILSGIMLGKDAKAEEPPKAPELPPIPTPDPDPVHAEVAPLQTAAADDHHDDHIA
jgi:Na+-transporting methylmalonyl-CoA/oxaloacetate decarboxylase gamma subunit